MKINLPDITIQPEWTEASQVKKILEEVGEVAEALVQDDPENVVREALDSMQTCKTLIVMQVKKHGLNINRFTEEHQEKLIRKGYINEQIPR